MAGVSLAALLVAAPSAWATECVAGAPPADVASPASLYEQLRLRTSAQLLSIGFLNKPVADACTWIYEVKVLTVSGSVVELDFAASSLDLVGARGPRDDGEAAALVRGLGADGAILVTGSDTPSSGASGVPDSDPDDGDADESGSGGSGEDGSGEGADGSSGEGGSGDGGESGSDDGGDSGDGDSGEGGDDSGGGDSGEGGDDSGGGDSGEGGSGDSGSGGSGEGGEGGDD